MAQVRNRTTKTRPGPRAARPTRKAAGRVAPARARRSGRWTLLFEEGNAQMRDLLGGKGAGLAEMSRIGLPVPPGFTITTEACLEYIRRDRRVPDGLMDEVRRRIRVLEERTGKRFGDPARPLLVSVRSGAKFSMPGMMDTVLNLGLNPQTVEGLAKATGDRRFAFDSYRRFMQMFGNVVLGVKHEHFEEQLAALKAARGVSQDTDLTAADLEYLTERYREVVRRQTGQEFPDDVWTQLEMAIRAVFDSWNNPRAVTYRTVNKIPHDLGTAVNVQTMVFGNMGSTSGTGVAFTRNPATGEKRVYGEYLLNAQGEDVVAGIRTPKPIEELERELPQAYREFMQICQVLERHYRDVQDVEFTIENGRLYILQTRSGKRTAPAAVKTAVDMVHEGLISKEEAVLRVDPASLEQLLHPRLDPSARTRVIARGLAASPGAASGVVVLDADRAVERSKTEKVILVRPETNPDDIHGLVAAQGVLTTRGGMTSHAAIVARGMGKPAVVGAEAIRVDEVARTFSVDGLVIREGEVITIDGSSGEVMQGQVPVIEPTLTGQVQELLRWADEFRTLGVRANADYPRDAAKAREFGAEGIGLCRTEHMFMEEDRLPIMQQMIMAETAAERRRALDRLLQFQKEDFKGLFRVMSGLPVIIRLLDPPLHEFLPRLEELLVEVTELRLRGETERLREREAVLRRVQALHEFNPMLGLRGCRLGILYPEINEMQVRAILLAAVELKKDEGIDVVPEIMIPLVGTVNELKLVHDQLQTVAQEVVRTSGVKVRYMFGTMIEIPRACLIADQIAEIAEFFSYGTNDLTQTIFGFSRDDAQAKFLHVYLEKGILKEDPFQVLDREGVGALMRIGTERGKKTRRDLEVGICGEHGGEPSSVEFCHQIGLDYVSCSPYRVPVARLAAAHAALKEKLQVARDV
ncbi:MAG: pyruvate, phosphate dikinase [Armatimonadota bacterium]|nr:pyruvate, phosphate dikinase [Armatimonadota bacterium]MDR7451270.1 pyruvate, phosphate dikinase [Armatimonadota bacterium]MDR7466827.1 pyruvate, phosphate dikinase [Armatimonadota bacterium]MDR7492700.1 pyruvate, phosphate dikinase [Armatimonadota bacterium]MDR7499629.1 pyruvate, phosphate dikinase [Armatimonadota bacterium]